MEGTEKSRNKKSHCFSRLHIIITMMIFIYVYLFTGICKLYENSSRCTGSGNREVKVLPVEQDTSHSRKSLSVLDNICRFALNTHNLRLLPKHTPLRHDDGYTTHMNERTSVFPGGARMEVGTSFPTSLWFHAMEAHSSILEFTHIPIQTNTTYGS